MRGSRIMTRFFRLSGLIVAFGLLAGCTDVSLHPAPQIAAQPDKVSAMLAQAADRASNSLQTLAAIEQARTPAIAVAPIDNAPPELRRAITVNWTGPAEQILKTLADRAGYMLEVLGDPPPVPTVVSVNVENKPVVEVMRSVGLQLGARADVHVDAQRQTVELHYAPNTGMGE